jgi:hypothetical protein
MQRTAQWILTAALAAALPASARAQGTPPPPSVPAAPAQSPRPTPPIVASTPNPATSIANEWVVSGFVGSDFGSNVNSSESSPHYGGTVAYLWNGRVGGELLAASTPDFELTNLFFTEKPMVNSYMANIIGAVPFGVDGQYQPFVSGGFGGIQLHQDVFNVINNPASGSSPGDAVKFGGNIGAGIMAYVRNVGIRGDVRYFRTRSEINNSITSPSDAIADSALAGLDFWRANVGVAFRW